MLLAYIHNCRNGAKHLRVGQSQFSEHLKTKLQRIGSPARWIPSENAWDCPVNPASVTRLGEIARELGEVIDWKDGLQAYADEHLKQSDYEHEVRLAMERILQAKNQLAPYVTLMNRADGQPCPPLWHQTASYHWSIRVRGLLLAHDPGVGKTRSACDASGGWYRLGQIQPMQPQVIEGKPAVAGGVLVVCPKTMLKTWQEELARWQNAHGVIIAGEAVKKARLAGTPAHYHIVNYEGLRYVTHNHYQGVIFDECFVAGTPVWTTAGPKPIEEVVAGDVVLAYSHDANRIECAKVTAAMKSAAKESLVRVTTESESMVCTAGHPWFDGDDYTPAACLEGKTVCVPMLNTARLMRNAVRSIDVDVAPAGTAVYNIEVEGYHNYFVGRGRHLVHNCHRLANHTNQTDNALTISERCQKRLGLTGTPIANDLKSIFYPMLILDGGRALGPSRTAFLEKYFNSSRSFAGFAEYEAKDDAATEIARAIATSTYFVKKEECLDLPPKTHTPIYLPMTPEQARYYQSVKREAITYIQDATVTIEQASARCMKLMQICQGFALTDVGDDEDKGSQGRHFTDAKTEALMEMLTDQLRGRKVIVWTLFKYETRRLVEALEKAGVSYLRIDGTIKSQRERDAAKDRWNSDPSVTVFVRQLSMSEGVTLLGTEDMPCYTTVYLSLNYSMVNLLQSMDRVHRIGQKAATCDYIYLLTENGIDRQVYARLLEKVENANKVISIGKGWFRELLLASAV